MDLVDCCGSLPMNGLSGLAGRLRLPAAALPLGIFVVLRGLNAPVLKQLQQLGLQHPHES